MPHIDGRGQPVDHASVDSRPRPTPESMRDRPCPPAGRFATVAADERAGWRPSEIRVSTIELFFDLVFVFTITQLTSLLVAEPDVPRCGAGGADLRQPVVDVRRVRVAHERGPAARPDAASAAAGGDGRVPGRRAVDPRRVRRRRHRVRDRLPDRERRARGHLPEVVAGARRAGDPAVGTDQRHHGRDPARRGLYHRLAAVDAVDRCVRRCTGSRRSSRRPRGSTSAPRTSWNATA